MPVNFTESEQMYKS